MRFGPWILLCIIFSHFYEHAVQGQPPSPKSLVIALDGLRGDGILNSTTPNIDRLINGTFGTGQGVDYRGGFAHYAQTIMDAPTVSGPNHASIMTGVTATKHGIFGNFGIGNGNFDSYPHYLTTLETEDAGLNTAYLFTWSGDSAIPSGADFIKDSTDEENTLRAAEIVAGSFEGSGDQGTSWAAGTDVDALFIFYDDIDLAGHASGFSPRSTRYVSAIEKVDSQVGQILSAIESRPSFVDENWQVVITSDHGGRGSSHGFFTADNFTIPFLVASRDAAQGYLAGTPSVVDVAPTAVQHMLGSTGLPSHYDGQPRDEVIDSNTSGFDDGLVVYVPFDGSYLDRSGRNNHASVGLHSDHDPILHVDNGLFGGYVEINDLGGGPDNASYVTLGKPADLQFGLETDFSFSFWYRKPGRAGGIRDTMIFGDVDFMNGFEPGVALSAFLGREIGTFSGTVADTTSHFAHLDEVIFARDEWWFLAATYDRDGSLIIYAGNAEGDLHVLSSDLNEFGDIQSSLPLNIGQDGSGAYENNLDGDIDDLGIWRRALTLDEILQIYNQGSGTSLGVLIPEPSVYCLLTMVILCMGATRRRRPF